MITAVTDTKVKASTFGVSTDMRPFDYLGKKELLKVLDLVTSFNEVATNYEDKEAKSINKAWTVLSLLDVDKIWLFERNSRADSYLKLDMMVKAKDRYVGFQLKSSLFNFSKYVETYKDKLVSPYYQYGHDRKYEELKSWYNAPGCVWCNDQSNASEMMLELSKWLDIPASLKTMNSYKKFKMVKSSGIKELDDFTTKTFRINADDIHIWSVLGKAQIQGRELVYL